VHDLEQALAIEASRSGHTEGEATAVLRGLSGDTADFAPFRMRRPGRAMILGAIAALVVIALVVVLAFRTREGTTGGAEPGGAAGLVPVELASDAVSDFDPEPPGDGEESPGDVRNAIDGSLVTLWTTDRYNNEEFGNLKPGVGLYVDAGAPVPGRRMSLITPTPGWAAEVYVANDPLPDSLEGWTKAAEAGPVAEQARIALDLRGREFRYYLVWITRLPEGNRAEIQELTLSRAPPGQ